jgi:hydrogenase/urease accessory protein HupE
MSALGRSKRLALGARFVVASAAMLVVLLVAGRSSAHTVGISRGEYRAVPAGLEVSLAFARSELTAIGGASHVVDRFEVRTSAPCNPELTKAVMLERDGVELQALFRCRSPGPIHVSLAPLFRELGRGHRHEATTLPNGVSTLLFEGEPELVVRTTESPPGSTAEAEQRPTSLFGFVRLGIEHILTGYDHLVFLLGLVIVGLGTQRTILVASAFALAHSLSLVACTLGAWTPPSSIVEPAIALSIAYVGVENLVSKSHERRAWLAFAFGLIHGFGFASVLSDTDFRGVELALALAGFNAGVELGQLLVLALLLPLIARARARPAFTRYGVRPVSVGVAAMGAVWFVVRVTGIA